MGLETKCFLPPRDCHNCESRGRQPFDNSSLKRCTRCKLMTYCNKDCQLEHWYRHHKTVCKVISGEKEDKTKIHPKFCGTMRLKLLKDVNHQGRDNQMEGFDCEFCKQAKTSGFDAVKSPLSPVMSCHIGCTQLNVKYHMLENFGYVVDNKRCDDTFPIPLN